MPSETIITTPADETAEEKLTRLEVEQTKEFEALAAKTPAADTTPTGDRAPGDDKPGKAAPDSTPTVTPSDADKEKHEVEVATAEAEKEGKELDVDDKGKPKRDAQGKFVRRDKTPVEQPIALTKEQKELFDKYLTQKQGSKYAKDFARRTLTWVEINAEKDRLATERTNWDNQLKEARTRFDADVQAFRQERDSAVPTPEKYEAFATKCSDLAKVKEAEAIIAVNAGEIEKAEALRREALILNEDANRAKTSAEHLRKNPPPDAKALRVKFQENQKSWIDKAKIDFPNITKEVTQTALDYHKEMCKDPAVARLPGVIYFAIERAVLKTAADRVPGLEKELGELRTKVKEQDEMLNPTPSGGVAHAPQVAKAFEEMSDDEQYAALHSEAAGRR